MTVSVRSAQVGTAKQMIGDLLLLLFFFFFFVFLVVVEEEEEEEVGDGPGPDPHHADGVVPDRLPAVTVAATTMPTIGETTGSVLSVFSVILHEGLSV